MVLNAAFSFNEMYVLETTDFNILNNIPPLKNFGCRLPTPPEYEPIRYSKSVYNVADILVEFKSNKENWKLLRIFP